MEEYLPFKHDLSEVRLVGRSVQPRYSVQSRLQWRHTRTNRETLLTIKLRFMLVPLCWKEKLYGTARRLPALVFRCVMPISAVEPSCHHKHQSPLPPTLPLLGALDGLRSFWNVTRCLRLCSKKIFSNISYRPVGLLSVDISGLSMVLRSIPQLGR